MAHIVRSSVEPQFTKTHVELVGDLAPLKAYYGQTPAHSETRVDADWYSGAWIPPELVPGEARITTGGTLYDWQATINSAPLVSEKFRACVEELDPGRHQFFPMCVFDRDGARISAPFYVFKIHGYIDSIIEERSNFKASGRGQIRGWGYSRVGAWKCALNKAIIETRAAWIELRYSRHWFFSDMLVSLLKERGVEGVDFNEFCEEV